MSTDPCPRCGGPHPPADPCPGIDLTGRTLADGLLVHEKLRDTGHGAHYRATHADSGVEVEVVSFYSQSQDEGSDQPVDPARLWDQFSRLNSIKHPNIARVRGMGGTPEGLRYVALEVLRGELLSEIIETRPTLPLQEAVDLMRQAAGGLEAAHEAGLLHGNLSPQSILVTPIIGGRPLVKLIRFENCPWTSHPSRGGDRYSAPERLSGHRGDERSDVFSLGAIFHHLVVGTPPGAERVDAEAIPEAVRPVVVRALDWLPSRRYQNVGSFARALAEIDTSPEPEVREPVRRRNLAPAIGAGLGALVAAGAWFLWNPMLPGAYLPPAGNAVPASTTVTPEGEESARAVPGSGDSAPARSLKPSSHPAPAPAASARRGTISTSGSSVATPIEPRQSAPPTRRPSSEGATPAAPEPPEPDPATAVTPVPAAADSGRGYAPGVGADSTAVSPRALARSEAMRRALSDVLRLGIVSNYEEVKPGLLVLVLGKGYHTATSVEYNFKQLYAAYISLLNYPDEHPVMELWQRGEKIGEYTRDGMLIGSDYSTPR